MLVRKEKEKPFIGFKVHIYVEDYYRWVICRYTAEFTDPLEAEEFIVKMDKHKEREEELKGVLHPNDDFQYIEIFEHTEDGIYKIEMQDGVIANFADDLKKEIEKKGLDKKLERLTGLTLKDLQELPPMSFDDFEAFLNKKCKENE